MRLIELRNLYCSSIVSFHRSSLASSCRCVFHADRPCPRAGYSLWPGGIFQARFDRVILHCLRRSGRSSAVKRLGQLSSNASTGIALSYRVYRRFIATPPPLARPFISFRSSSLGRIAGEPIGGCSQPPQGASVRVHMGRRRTVRSTYFGFPR